MGIVFKNNAKTTLASSLSNSATSATVTDGSVFPTLGAGEFFLITFDDGTNNEICKCTARSSNTLTIVRAQDNTSARSFSSGDAAEGRVTAGVLETIQENIAAKSADQTVYNATTASSATAYNIGIDPGVEANAMVFLDGVMQHHDTFSFSGSTLTFDAAPTDGTKLEVIVDNLINLQSSNLTVDSFTAADVGGSAQTDFTLSDTPAAETNLIVFVEGVFQDQDAYTISSNTLTITTGVIAGRGVTVYVINPVNIGTPSDGTITSAKLSGNLTLPGTLTVGANDVAFDSPTFVVDNSNSRVGLGTASPTVPVDIVGETKMSSHLTILDAGSLKVGTGADLVISSDGTDGTIATTNDLILTATDIRPRTDLFVLNNAANNKNQIVAQSGAIKLFYDGAEQLETVDGAVKINNKLGIGTASPSKTFHVYNTAAADVGLLESTQAYSTLSFKSSTNASTVTVGIDGAGNASFENKLSSGDMTFVTNGSERIRIEADGKVGIGTTSPATALEVIGSDPNDNVSRVVNIKDDRGYAADVGGSISLFGKYNSSGSYSTYGQIIGAKENGTDGNYAGYLAFKTRSSSALPSERMRIDANGRLNIGHTSSSANGGAAVLSIGNTAGGTINLIDSDDAPTNGGLSQIYGGNQRMYFYTGGSGASSYMQFYTNDAERMRITSSGEVLIGVTSSTGMSGAGIETSGSIKANNYITSTDLAGSGFRNVNTTASGSLTTSTSLRELKENIEK